MKTNLNAVVRVKLTDAGDKTYRQFHERLIGLPLDLIPPRLDADGFFKTQLWVLMQVFGPVTFMGMGNQHFENNEIEIVESEE